MFIGQPEEGQRNALDFVLENLADPEMVEFRVASAWVHAPGVASVASALAAFRRRGGRSSVLCGLSLGGATVEGLRAARDAFDESFVAFDPTGRTVHPKIYLFTGQERTALLVGSQNLSRSGLVFNHEAGIAIEGRSDADVFQQARTYLNRLFNDSMMTKRLTDEVIAELIESDQVELDVGIAASDPRPTDENGEGELFVRSLRSFQGYVRSAPDDETPTPEPTVVVRRWYKSNIRSSDAQRLEGSSPTNHLTLTAAGHPVESATWFRYVLFADEQWILAEPVSGKEHAEVTFVVHGLQGTYSETMRTTYNPRHASDQNNRTTSIEYGVRTRSLLRHDVDVRGLTVSLERHADTSYHLTFGAQATGEFV